jgi:hypothetical protein
MGNLLAKLKHKPIFWLGTGVAIGGLGFAISIGISMRSRVDPSPQQVGYTSAAKLATSQEIDRVIQANVKLSKDFRAGQIAKNLLATEIVSGGTTFIIYRFNFPQTCGKAGCLHVAVDRRSKVSIPLQLFDLPDKTIPFTSLTNTGCFSVKQPSNGAIEDYEICQSN